MALWGGRFSDGPADALFALSRSVQFDWVLAPYDLRSSLVHLSILEKAGLVQLNDGASIRAGLMELRSEVASGSFLPIESDEDVHSALERGLTEKLGTLGGALRAGRSRNDQVATDLRLFTIDQLLEVGKSVIKLQIALLHKSKDYVDAPAPGFTHLQHAQPIVFGHELAKHAHALQRDTARIQSWYARSRTSPMGAGALSGSSLALDPVASAHALGFSFAYANSVDAVSDRDFLVEALFILALIGSHLSRMGEEWCLWSSTEFGWAKLADAYATGSSIMPQKKNPDIAELARGKAGRLIGNLTSVLAMLKGLPFAYNRDLQEDKEPLFDSFSTLNLVLPAFTGMVETTIFDRQKMAKAAPTGFSLATEIADYLVKKGTPFAQAHEVAGKCVHLCEQRGIELHELSDSDLTNIHPALKPDVREVLSVEGALASRTTFGGTAPAAVVDQINTLLEAVAVSHDWFYSESNQFSGMMGA